MFDAAGTSADSLEEMLSTLASLPRTTDDSERVERLRVLEQLRGAVAAAQALETAAFAASRRAAHRERPVSKRVAERDAEREVTGQVALARRISPHQARRYVGFATILTRELPDTFTVLRAGGTSEWRALQVAQHTVFLSLEHRREVDRAMAPQLGELGDKRVEAEVRRHAYRLDPRGYVDRMSAAAQDRRVSVRPAPDTMVRLSALLPVVDGVAVQAALDREAAARRGAGDPRSRGQLMADTLVERVLGHSAASVPIELELVMTDRSLLAPPPVTGDEAKPAWLVGYGPLPSDFARALVLDAPATTPRWIRRLFGSPDTGELAALESRRRLFTPAQRRFVRLRDQWCRTPYCGAPMRHIDHVVPAEHGGATSVDNAQGLCEACNYIKQVPGWRTDVLADGTIEIRPPTGRAHPSAVPRPPGRPSAASSPPGRRRRARRPRADFHFQLSNRRVSVQLAQRGSTP